MTFELPLASMHLYYPPFLSLEPHLFHFHLESKTCAIVWEHKHIFFNQEGSNTHFKETISSQTKFFNEKHQHTSRTSHSIFLTISHFTSKHSPSNFEHHFTGLSIGSTNSSWLSFHIAFKTLKFDLILDLNIIFSDLACTIQLLHSCIKLDFFLIKISVLHMKFIRWPTWQAC